MRLNRTLTALLSVFALAACEKNAVRDLTGPAPSARVRFFNWGLNAPSVHFYAGDEKLTATSSGTCSTAKNPPVTATDTLCLTEGVEAAGAIAFGAVSSNGLYTAIDPGQYTFQGRIMTGADKGLAISNIAANVEDGKFYSVYQSGPYNTTTKTSDGFVVEDNLPAVDWTQAYVRLVNGSHNSQPMTLYITSTDPTQPQPPTSIAIGGAVAYKSAGEFVAVPRGTYNLVTRYTGSTTDRIVRTNVFFEPGYVYTITARGDMTVTSTTAANRPFLDNTRNR